MGTWGPGPFDGDAAADFLEELRASPSRAVSRALQTVTKAADGDYLDADVGGAAWAACEVVALSFGYGDTPSTDAALEGVGKVAPTEKQRVIALAVLSRIAKSATSELAALWHEGSDGKAFEVSLEHLCQRLEAASHGARSLPKAKVGDVLCFAAAPSGSKLVVVQVVGPGEVAVMVGTYEDDAAALASVTASPAHRVPAPVGKLFRESRLLGNVPVRKGLKGKKLYAGETGVISDYVLATASAGGARIVSYEDARDCDLLKPHHEAALRAIAMGTTPNERVRSPGEREAELAARKGGEWAARREATAPGPFGDPKLLEELMKWMADYGADNAINRFHDETTGTIGYGRPNEYPERRSYAFAGIVALWFNVWPSEAWPAELTFPPAPVGPLRERALAAARILITQVITQDAELRMIWERAADRGAALYTAVSSLKEALLQAG
jgi:hypothetical protein